MFSGKKMGVFLCAENEVKSKITVSIVKNE